MRTQIKFNRLAKLPAEQAKATLAEAISFEINKPGILMDALGKDLAAGRKARLDDATVTARVKAFLAEKYASSSSNPILVDLASEFAAFFHSNMPEIDTGWMSLFDLVDMRGSTHDHFDIVDTNAGVTYEQIKPGAEIKKRTGISESSTRVGYVTYGAGLGILDDWIEKQQFWKVDDAVNEFRAKHFDKMAEVHYGLFTGLSSAIDVAFSTDDATTFNAAVATMLRAVRSSGYAVGQNAPLKIITSYEQVGRVKRMLEATSGSVMVAYGTQKQPIAYTVDEVIATTFVSASDTGYYLVLPNRKVKRGLWKDLSIEQARNAAARATDWYASAQYNAAIGDTAQVRRVKFS